jgi:hypothetical protein
VSKPPNIEAAVLFRPIPQGASQAWGQVSAAQASQRVGKLRRPCVDDLAAVRCAMKLRTRKLLEWLDRTSPSAGPGGSQCERRSLPSSGWSLWHCRFPADRSMLKTIRGVRKFGTVRETAASLATSNAGRQAAGVIATPCTSRRPGSRGHVAGRACRGKVPERVCRKPCPMAVALDRASWRDVPARPPAGKCSHTGATWFDASR